MKAMKTKNILFSLMEVNLIKKDIQNFFIAILV